MTTTEIQIARDPSASSLGSDGVLHITALGDSAPLCDDDSLTLVDWSEPMGTDAAGAILIAPDYPICGKCSDAFWSGDLDA